jgi:hypothetical protein
MGSLDAVMGDSVTAPEWKRPRPKVKAEAPHDRSRFAEETGRYPEAKPRAEHTE